jgi:hypothetical protein
MGLTTDPEEARNSSLRPDGQQETYVVLSPEERAKGFVRPVRLTYRHLTCGAVTRMAQAIAETYARNPTYYGGTFCCRCGTHPPVSEFVWEGTEEKLGSLLPGDRVQVRHSGGKRGVIDHIEGEGVMVSLDPEFRRSEAETEPVSYSPVDLEMVWAESG